MIRKIKQYITELLEVPWKRRVFGGLAIAGGVLIFFSFIYQPYSMEGDMGLKIIVCPFRNLTGLPCPGCGLTRAVYHLARGDFAKALSFHIFSPLFYVALVMEIVNSIMGIIRRGKPLFYWGDLFNRKVVKYPTYVFIVVVVCYNFYRIWQVFNEPPQVPYAVTDSIVFRVISLFK